MNLAELGKLLYQLDVPPSLYRLEGSHFELANVVTRHDGRWRVFLSERATDPTHASLMSNTMPASTSSGGYVLSCPSSAASE